MKIEALNRLTDSPLTTWTKGKDGKMKSIKQMAN